MRDAGRRLMVVLAVLATVLAASATQAASRDASEIVQVDDIGSGAKEIWALLPSEDPPTCLLVFLHGADPTPARILGWLDHLALDMSCAVIFPRYQPSATATSPALGGLRAAISTGVQHVRRARYGFESRRSPSSLHTIVVGVGFGGSLAFSYAANAQRWGLPVPAAIDSIFPTTGRIPGGAATIPRTTRVLVQVGDKSRVAAGELRTVLASHSPSRKRFQTIRSRPGLRATEEAPLQSTDAAVNTFWAPLDALIDAPD
jgi:hypothetical protein